jgi:hypothetical protein
MTGDPDVAAFAMRPIARGPFGFRVRRDGPRTGDPDPTTLPGPAAGDPDQRRVGSRADGFRDRIRRSLGNQHWRWR